MIEGRRSEVKGRGRSGTIGITITINHTNQADDD